MISRVWLYLLVSWVVNYAVFIAEISNLTQRFAYQTSIVPSLVCALCFDHFEDFVLSYCGMSNIENLKGFDPFADAAKGDDDGVQDGLVHVRIQQRNGRKTLTTVQGLSAEYDLKVLLNE